MPRQPKLDATGSLHHVMCRGIDKIQRFRNRKDREDVLNRLADLCRADAQRVYAWTLMSNRLPTFWCWENKTDKYKNSYTYANP